MPYAYRKIRNQNAYRVFNKITGVIHSNHTTLDNAKKQIKLLNAIENNPDFKPKKGKGVDSSLYTNAQLRSMGTQQLVSLREQTADNDLRIRISNLLEGRYDAATSPSQTGQNTQEIDPTQIQLPTPSPPQAVVQPAVPQAVPQALFGLIGGVRRPGRQFRNILQSSSSSSSSASSTPRQDDKRRRTGKGTTGSKEVASITEDARKRGEELKKRIAEIEKSNLKKADTLKKEELKKIKAELKKIEKEDPDYVGIDINTGKGLPAGDIQKLLKNSYQIPPAETVGDFVLDKSLSGRRVQVYKNRNTPQAVVVHRGTQGVKDWATDLFYATGGDTTQTNRFKHAADIQKKAESKYGAKNITTLGHSLGAKISSTVGQNSKEIINLNKAVSPLDALQKTSSKEINIRTSGDPVSALLPIRNNERTITIPSKTYNPFTEHKTDTLNRLPANQIIGSGAAVSAIRQAFRAKPYVIEGLERIEPANTKEAIFLAVFAMMRRYTEEAETGTIPLGDTPFDILFNYLNVYFQTQYDGGFYQEIAARIINNRNIQAEELKEVVIDWIYSIPEFQAPLLNTSAPTVAAVVEEPPIAEATVQRGKGLTPEQVDAVIYTTPIGAILLKVLYEIYMDRQNPQQVAPQQQEETKDERGDIEMGQGLGSSKIVPIVGEDISDLTDISDISTRSGREVGDIVRANSIINTPISNIGNLLEQLEVSDTDILRIIKILEGEEYEGIRNLEGVIKKLQTTLVNMGKEPPPPTSTRSVGRGLIKRGGAIKPLIRTESITNILPLTRYSTPQQVFNTRRDIIQFFNDNVSDGMTINQFSYVNGFIREQLKRIVGSVNTGTSGINENTILNNRSREILDDISSIPQDTKGIMGFLFGNNPTELQKIGLLMPNKTVEGEYIISSIEYLLREYYDDTISPFIEYNIEHYNYEPDEDDEEILSQFPDNRPPKKRRINGGSLAKKISPPNKKMVGKTNPWVEYVKSFAKGKGINYRSALKHPDISKGYKKGGMMREEMDKLIGFVDDPEDREIKKTIKEGIKSPYITAKQEDLVKCPYCKEYYKYKGLSRHIAQVHPGLPVEYQKYVAPSNRGLQPNRKQTKKGGKGMPTSRETVIAEAYNERELGANGGKRYVSL